MQTELSFSRLLNETINFIRNRFQPIIIICFLISATTTPILNNLFDKQLFQQLSNQSPYAVLLQLLKPAMIYMVINFMTQAIILAVIYNYSISNKFNFNLILSRLLPNILNLIGLNLVCACLIVTGLIFMLLICSVLNLILPIQIMNLLILTVTIVVMIVISIVYFQFNSLIIEPSTKDFFQKFIDCFTHTLMYWRLTLPMFLIYFLAIFLLSHWAISITSLMINIIYSTIIIFANIFMICFLYRLNMLLKNQHKTQ